MGIGDIGLKYSIAGLYASSDVTGPSTSALCIGGQNPPGTPRLSATEVWSGSSWAEEGDLNTARTNGGIGNTTNALAVAGSIPPYTGVVEEWSPTTPSTVTFTAS